MSRFGEHWAEMRDLSDDEFNARMDEMWDDVRRNICPHCVGIGVVGCLLAMCLIAGLQGLLVWVLS